MSATATNTTTVETQLLQQDPTLTHLCLTLPLHRLCNARAPGTKVDPFAVLVKAVARSTTVTKITIGSEFILDIGTARINSMFEGVCKAAALTDLTMQHFAIKTHEVLLERVFVLARRLERVVLCNMKLLFYRGAYPLRDYQMTNNPAIALESVSIQNVSIISYGEPYPLNCLFYFLSKCPQLRTIHFMCQYSDEKRHHSGLYFAKLASAPNLQFLKFEGLRIQAIDLEVLCCQINKQQWTNITSLSIVNVDNEHFNFGEMGDFCEWFLLMRNLDSLQLVNCCLVDDDAQDLVTTIEIAKQQRRLRQDDERREFIPPSRPLRELDLSLNKLQNAFVTSFAQHLKLDDHQTIALTHLTMCYCDFRDSAAVELAESLKSNTTLLHLDIGKNEFYDETFSAFADALGNNNNSTLQTLNFACNNITRKYPTIRASTSTTNHIFDKEDVYSDLYNMLQTNTTLTVLTIQREEWDSTNNYYSWLKPFLLMNRLGRRQLLEPGSSIADWHQMLVDMADYQDAIFYLLTKNPAIVASFRDMQL